MGATVIEFRFFKWILKKITNLYFYTHTTFILIVHFYGDLYLDVSNSLKLVVEIEISLCMVYRTG